MKRSSLKLLSMLMMLVMFIAGCGTSGGDTSSDTGSSDTGSSTSGESTKSEKPVELSVMIWDRGNAAPGTTNEDNTLTDYIKEQMLELYNIEVSYVTVPRSGSDDKVNVMMAGGNAPDIVFTYSQQLFGDYAAKGGLTDLTSALETNGGTINELIGDIQVMGKVDGAQYAIMKRRGYQSPRHVAYIRKDWLDAIGLDVPTNKVELEDALLAIKEQNPGNVDNLVPWAMGGSADTEKFYLNFIGSYVGEISGKDAYVYSENFKIFADGGLEGLKVMNRFYNEGLISPDFAVDTTTDQYKQDVSVGNAAFVLDDATRPIELFQVLDTTDSEANFVPVNPFDTPQGTVINPTEPLYGMYIMVPKTSEEKADAALTYLNWMADPEVAQIIEFSPEHTVNEAGVPVPLTEDERNEKGYPGTMADYNIINQHFSYVEDKDAMVSSWMAWDEGRDQAWYEMLYDVQNENMFVYPAVPVILESEAKYFSIVQDLAIEYVYKMISCSADEFDELQKVEYAKLVDAGLETILEDRAAYWDANLAE